MRFTLRQLQVFVAVAKQESVSRAAQSLALSQSAASTSLSELERQSDCQLFDRAGKRLILNALGQQLLPQAVALLDQAREIEQLLNGKSGFGSLEVGATLTVGNYLATLLIGSFMQRHPECRVKLQVHNTAHVVQQVAHYELDLGLIEGDCQHPDIEVQPWVEDELVVFCAPQHPFARSGQASLEELTREAWVLREQGSGTRLTDLMRSGKLFADIGLPPINPQDDRAMICGSPSMLDETSEVLDSFGLKISARMREPGDYLIERAFVEK